MDLAKEIGKLATKFDEEYEKAESAIDLNSMKLKEALISQLPLQLKWEAITKKANWLFDLVEYEVDNAYANAMSKELKDSYRSTTITEAREFAKIDKTYIKWRKVLAEIRYLRDECRGVLEVITSRKYVLNNISNTVIGGVENHLI